MFYQVKKTIVVVITYCYSGNSFRLTAHKDTRVL